MSVSRPPVPPTVSLCDVSLRDLGLRIGGLKPGRANTIADVPGVTVGHLTLSDGPVQTGCTAVHLHQGHPFRDKLPAAGHVLNGFGKSVGLVQIAELGTIETPVLLTNTLSVGTAATALVRHLLDMTPEIGAATGTVNPMVLECNDGAWLNDIRGLHLTEEHVRRALAEAGTDVRQGNLGAGTGMSCHGLAGGIGSASRRTPLGGVGYTLGVLTLCNMGRLEDLRVDGRPVGPAIASRLREERPASDAREHGSIIVLIATDAPLDARQLRRLAARSGAGIARVGSHFGSGSGDIALAVSTAEPIPHRVPEDPVLQRRTLHEDRLDTLFRAVVETTEEAILSALLAAKPRTGRDGNRRRALSEFLDLLTVQTA